MTKFCIRAGRAVVTGGAGLQALGMDHGDGNDMNSLAWMAPDFELEDLL